MELIYTIHRDAESMTIALAGELDMATADELCDLLLEAIGRNDTTEVVVNLDRVTFVDSAAIGAFVAGLRSRPAVRCASRTRTTRCSGSCRAPACWAC